MAISLGWIMFILVGFVFLMSYARAFRQQERPWGAGAIPARIGAAFSLTARFFASTTRAIAMVLIIAIGALGIQSGTAGALTSFIQLDPITWATVAGMAMGLWDTFVGDISLRTGAMLIAGVFGAIYFGRLSIRLLINAAED